MCGTRAAGQYYPRRQVLACDHALSREEVLAADRPLHSVPMHVLSLLWSAQRSCGRYRDLAQLPVQVGEPEVAGHML